MKESLHLSQQSKLQQKLNPKQVVFGRYLEMTAPEIEDEVRRQLDENPALEAISETSLPEHENDSFGETAEQLQLADYGNDDDIPSYRFEAHNHSIGDEREFVMAGSQPSLIDILIEQLGELNLDSREMKVARYIVGNIDDNGYITRSLYDIDSDISIAEDFEPGLPMMRRVFGIIRGLDPAGVGAVDLRDCLLLQIERRPNSLTKRIAYEIIDDWFDLFSKKHFDQIRSHLGIENEELARALDYIRALNPKPGALVEAAGDEDRLRHIIPDFAVEIDSDGKATVTLLNNIPELAIEQSFQIDDARSTASRRDMEAMAFIKRRHDDAATFIAMMKMRSETLMKVMTAVVKIQHTFFRTGDRSDIRPMIIKDIAAMTGLNISVISRATAGKFILYPFGIVALKTLFNERPKEDIDTSSHEILDALAEIIDNEDKTRPLSDEALCSALSKRGYDIARRTVTKYRERLGKPVARLRKQF